MLKSLRLQLLTDCNFNNLQNPSRNIKISGLACGLLIAMLSKESILVVGAAAFLAIQRYTKNSMENYIGYRAFPTWGFYPNLERFHALDRAASRICTFTSLSAV